MAVRRREVIAGQHRRALFTGLAFFFLCYNFFEWPGRVRVNSSPFQGEDYGCESRPGYQPVKAVFPKMALRNILYLAVLPIVHIPKLGFRFPTSFFSKIGSPSHKSTLSELAFT